MLKALARAFRWQKLLNNGTYNTIKEIAAKEKINSSYVGDMLRLTLLAPDIIDDPRRPPAADTSFETLRKSLPLAWDEQAQANSRRRS